MSPEQSFGIIPMFREGNDISFLLIQHQAGHWAFPKGHVEGAETPLETAQREFEEETGIRNYVVDDAHTFFEQYEVIQNGQKVPKTVMYYPATVHSQTVTPQEKEIKDYGWFSFADAMNTITFEPSKKLLKDVEAYLTRFATQSEKR